MFSAWKFRKVWALLLISYIDPSCSALLIGKILISQKLHWVTALAMDPSSFVLITGQLRISPVWEDIWLMWISKAGPTLHSSGPLPASEPCLLESKRSQCTAEICLLLAEGPYCRALEFNAVLRISLAAAHGYEGTLSFSSGRAEQILSQAMEMRYVSKSCQWVSVQCLSVTLCALLLCLAKRCVSVCPGEGCKFATCKVPVNALAEPQTDSSAP